MEYLVMARIRKLPYVRFESTEGHGLFRIAEGMDVTRAEGLIRASGIDQTGKLARHMWWQDLPVPRLPRPLKGVSEPRRKDIRFAFTAKGLAHYEYDIRLRVHAMPVDVRTVDIDPRSVRVVYEDKWQVAYVPKQPRVRRPKLVESVQ